MQKELIWLSLYKHINREREREIYILYMRGPGGGGGRAGGRSAEDARWAGEGRHGFLKSLPKGRIQTNSERSVDSNTSTLFSSLSPYMYIYMHMYMYIHIA